MAKFTAVLQTDAQLDIGVRRLCLTRCCAAQSTEQGLQRGGIERLAITLHRLRNERSGYLVDGCWCAADGLLHGVSPLDR
jgi:hypothetical protein